MNSLRLCGASAATTDMLAMKRTFLGHRLRAAADDAGHVGGQCDGHLAGVTVIWSIRATPWSLTANRLMEFTPFFRWTRIIECR